MGHVFISYHHDDGDFAEILISRIEKVGLETWVDNDRLHAGEDWRTEIDLAIKDAFALIVIMSPEARASEYVTYEWAFAWGVGIKVIPVLYKATKLHPRLEALQYLDFTSRTARPWDALTEVVKNAASSYTPNSIASVQSIPSYLRQAIEELDSASAKVRKKAIESLAQLDHPVAQEALIRAMQHPLQDVRIQAALIRIGHNDLRALPGVIEALDVDDASTRQSALKTLDEIVNDVNVKKEITPFLIENLRNKNKKDFTRTHILTLLGKIGDSSVVPSVIEAVQDKSFYISGSALSVLGEIGDASAISTLGEALQSQSEYHRQKALEALAKIGDVTALPYLLEALRSDVGKKDEIHIDSALRQIGERLRQKGDTTAIPILLEALRDRKSEVRSGAAETLGELGSKDVITNLLETLNDEEESVQRSVIYALGEIKDVAAVPHLLRVLQTNNKWIRWNTVEALGKIGDATAIPGLLNTLNDDDDMVRRRTVEALGKIGGATAIPNLLKVLTDNDELLRSYAVDALKEIGDIGVVPDILLSLRDEMELVRRSAIKALVRFGSEAIPGLIEALHDEKEYVRKAATKGLVMIGEPAVPALLEAVQEENEVGRLQATRILRQISTPEAFMTIKTADGNEPDNNMHINAL